MVVVVETCLVVVVGGDELKMGMDMVRWYGLLGGTGLPKNPPIGGVFLRIYGGSLGVSKLIPEINLWTGRLV